MSSMDDYNEYMKNYRKIEDYFSKNDSIESIREKLSAMRPKKKVNNIASTLVMAGIGITKHSFIIGSCVGIEPGDEAEHIYMMLH